IRRVCKASGVTAVYVTHDQAEALSTADRIALLHEGSVAQVGTPRDLYERPASRAVAEFVGEANLLPGTVIDDTTVRCDLGKLQSARVPAGSTAGSAIVVCIRPERLRLREPGGTGNRVEGTITAASYQGDSGQWRIAVPSAKPVEITVSEPCPRARAVGDRLVVSIDPEDVVVLSA
ncbi:MAG: TOBE domain-containing protein, partial [Planctomycetes bacterium]|nr:TOBE domain-containing protein [Planctomycetota bacterium]